LLDLFCCIYGRVVKRIQLIGSSPSGGVGISLAKIAFTVTVVDSLDPTLLFFK
jgi:hypothetical protein